MKVYAKSYTTVRAVAEVFTIVTIRIRKKKINTFSTVEERRERGRCEIHTMPPLDRKRFVVRTVQSNNV